MGQRNTQLHSFHLVDPSPWPLISAFSACLLTTGGVLYFHGYTHGGFLWKFGFFMVLLMMFCWWRDVIREGTFEGQHTKSVQSGLRLGVLLFIVSEVMFFFAFFWAFFHSSFNPSFAIGGIWPPAYLVAIDPWFLPLLNTIVLLFSGATVTLAHHGLVARQYLDTSHSIWATVYLAFIFTTLQFEEYIHAGFSISDGIYGSTFYMATGFHGFHVFIGACFLTICGVRVSLAHFTREHHFGFEAAAWYWHFVDVVWLFLFITVYWWGS